jgi:predicted MFS family arabinose efflux permease
MCVGAPAFAAVVAGWDRRRLLAYSMAWSPCCTSPAPWRPASAGCWLLRVLALVPPAVFTPQAAACVGLLVPPAQRGRAITFIFLGWSVASVLGMPLGAWLGGTFGWRYAFAVSPPLSLVSMAWVWRSMPTASSRPRCRWDDWKVTFRSKALMTAVLVTVLYAAGQFVQFSYFAPWFKQKLGASPGELSLFFMWFGAFGLLGNVLMTRYIDRIGVERSVMIAIALMAVSLPASRSAPASRWPRWSAFPGRWAASRPIPRSRRGSSASRLRWRRFGGAQFVGHVCRPGHRRGQRRLAAGRHGAERGHRAQRPARLSASRPQTAP